jgi:hypothetical protein
MPILLAAFASGNAAVLVTPRNAIPIALTWNNGTITVTQNFCVQSTGANSPNATTPVIDYSVTAAAPFVLANGANQIPGSVSYRDLVTGVVTPLTAGVTTGDIMTGAPPGCPGGNNGQLTAVYGLSALTSAPPGVYTQSLVVAFSNANPGGPNNRTASLDLTLIIPDTMRISQLNDIDLGMFSGQNLTGQDSLCVFRASGLGYGVTVTGSGAGGSYTLTNGIDQLPFTVTWNDGSGATLVSPGVLLGGRANSFSGNNNCSNGTSNNATIAVTVLASDVSMNVASSGSFSGVLTIFVEMQ